jgi:hypothetical protein
MEQETVETPVVPEISVSELFEIANTGTRKLTPRERRRVIQFCDDHGVEDQSGKPKDFSNYELAKIFSVDEKIIRNDKKKLLKNYTSAITPEDAMSYVGEFVQGHDRLMRHAFRGLKASPEGTLSHQNYIKILSDLHKRKVGMLQEIGALPKELGHLNVSEEHWEAYIQDDGAGNATSGVRVLETKQLKAADDDDDDEVFEAVIEP